MCVCLKLCCCPVFEVLGIQCSHFAITIQDGDHSDISFAAFLATHNQLEVCRERGSKSKREELAENNHHQTTTDRLTGKATAESFARAFIGESERVFLLSTVRTVSLRALLCNVLFVCCCLLFDASPWTASSPAR
jgi:hypothetical protein